MARIVVDTNVLWDKSAMGLLRKQRPPLILPAIAFGERARQFRQRGWSLQDIWRLVEEAGLQVEPMGHVEAVRRTMDLGEASWSRLSRDAFIAGHVGPDDTLWTRNVQDFLDVGVPRAQIQDTAAF